MPISRRQTHKFRLFIASTSLYFFSSIWLASNLIFSFPRNLNAYFLFTICLSFRTEFKHSQRYKALWAAINNMKTKTTTQAMYYAYIVFRVPLLLAIESNILECTIYNDMKRLYGIHFHYITFIFGKIIHSVLLFTCYAFRRNQIDLPIDEYFARNQTISFLGTTTAQQCEY